MAINQHGNHSALEQIWPAAVLGIRKVLGNDVHASPIVHVARQRYPAFQVVIEGFGCGEAVGHQVALAG